MAAGKLAHIAPPSTSRFVGSSNGYRQHRGERWSSIDEALVALSRTLTRDSELRTDRAPRQTSGFRCEHGRLESFFCGATPRHGSTQLAQHRAIDWPHTALVDSSIQGRDEGVDVGVGQVAGMLLRSCHLKSQPFQVSVPCSHCMNCVFDVVGDDDADLDQFPDWSGPTSITKSVWSTERPPASEFSTAWRMSSSETLPASARQDLHSDKSSCQQKQSQRPRPTSNDRVAQAVRAGEAGPGASCRARVLASARSGQGHRGRRCWCRVSVPVGCAVGFDELNSGYRSSASNRRCSAVAIDRGVHQHRQREHQRRHRRHLGGTEGS